MDKFKEFFQNVSGLFGRMTPSQVMVLFGIVAGSIAGIVLLVGWLNSVAYAPLYSDLSEEEAGGIVNWLNDQHIPYKLTHNGKTIEVPSDQKYKARLELAAEGLPKSGTVGYSIFDNTNLGMTDFLQNLNFRRALEGELTKTIMSLNEIEAARVHIVIPKDRLFKEDKRDATASVVLKLKGNRTLDRQQTDGITHLVAASVEGLTPDNITIVDYNGNLLSSGQKGDPLAGLSSSQLDARQKVETYLEQKAQSMLDNVLGIGKTVVRVTADLNFSQLERTSENYDPSSAVVRSEERTKGTSSSEDKTAAAETKDAGSKENQNNETTVTNYEISKTVEHLIDAVGTIQKLSVAVLVDGNYVPATGTGATGEPTYQPRSQEELDRLSAIVKNAVGYNSDRNDQIEMVNIAFDRQGLDQERKALDTMYTREYYTDIGTKVGIGVLILLAFLYLKRKVSRFFAGLRPLMPAQTPVRYQAAATQTNQQEIPQMPMEPRKARVVDKLQDVARDKPEEIARVIKTMMVE